MISYILYHVVLNTTYTVAYLSVFEKAFSQIYKKFIFFLKASPEMARKDSLQKKNMIQWNKNITE